MLLLMTTLPLYVPNSLLLGGGGGSRINLKCFRTFLVLLCVLLIQMHATTRVTKTPIVQLSSNAEAAQSSRDYDSARGDEIWRSNANQC
jgi:hypothetical protein